MTNVVWLDISIGFSEHRLPDESVMAERDTQIVRTVLPDNTPFAVEVRAAAGYQPVGALESLPFEAVTNALVSIGNALNAAIERVGPKKASVEFGMEVTIEAGKLTALVCQGKTTANFTVTLEWER